jgi:hypothetical protein
MIKAEFEGYGIVILRRAGRLFVRYDAGHLLVEMTEVEISSEQAARLQLGEQEAHQVLLALQASLTIHSSRTRFVASRLRLGSRAGRLNSGVMPHEQIP